MPTAKTLPEALLAARSAMKDPRMAGNNPHFGSKFVPRDEVLDVVIPALLAEGVLLSQGVFGTESGTVMRTTAHGYGESLVLAEYPLPVVSDPQKFLAACTYASRGSLMLGFTLAGDADDDGHTAAKPEPPAASPNDGKVLPDTLTLLRAARAELGIDDDKYAATLAQKQFGSVTVDSDLTQAAAAKLLAVMNGKLKEAAL